MLLSWVLTLTNFLIWHSTQALSADVQDVHLVGSWAAVHPQSDSILIANEPILSSIHRVGTVVDFTRSDTGTTDRNGGENAEAVEILRASLCRQVPGKQPASTWCAISNFCCIMVCRIAFRYFVVAYERWLKGVGRWIHYAVMLWSKIDYHCYNQTISGYFCQVRLLIYEVYIERYKICTCAGTHVGE